MAVQEIIACTKLVILAKLLKKGEAVMQFGERLKKARTDKKVTQEEVAKAFFITRQTISNWETGKTYPDIDNLIKLSDYYAISLDILLKEDNQMVNHVEKQIVFRSIKPLICLLLISDIIFLLIISLQISKILRIDQISMLIIIGFGCLNAFTLIEASFINYKIASKLQKQHLQVNKFTIISSALIISGLLLSLVLDQPMLGGGVTGIGIASLIISLIKLKYQKN